MGETSPSDMILSTPFEFADSAARKNGLDCVDCHMSKQGDIPDHAFQGSRTAPQSYKGIIQIEGIEQRGNQVIVTVMNTVSGHWMPTGDETKVIFLEITAFDAQDQIVYRDEYRFEKVVFFFRTMPISGAKDTRLRDGERREIAFDVPALATRLNAAVKIKPRLWNNEIVEFVIDQQAAQILPAR